MIVGLNTYGQYLDTWSGESVFWLVSISKLRIIFLHYVAKLMKGTHKMSNVLRKRCPMSMKL